MLPENNEGIKLVPQLLCNAAEPFLAVARELREMGYEEVDLNVGCPSGTVVAKHKGAGMLGDLRQLDDCLADIFSRCPLKVSVKTRLGLYSAEEFPAIVEIYRKYPLSRLIVHVRDRDGMYKSEPDVEAFAPALSCPFPVEYNGNIFTPADLDSLRQRYPNLSAAMLGRGAVTNPALFRELRRGGIPRLRSCAELYGLADEGAVVLSALHVPGFRPGRQGDPEIPHPAGLPCRRLGAVSECGA